MSADAWRICPKCKQELEAKRAKAQEELQATYGVLTALEFIKKKHSFEAVLSENLDDTLREDYEIWMSEDGTFSVDYGCSCRVCGWEWGYGTKELAFKAVQS